MNKIIILYVIFSHYLLHSQSFKFDTLGYEKLSNEKMDYVLRKLLTKDTVNFFYGSYFKRNNELKKIGYVEFSYIKLNDFNNQGPCLMIKSSFIIKLEKKETNSFSYEIIDKNEYFSLKPPYDLIHSEMIKGDAITETKTTISKIACGFKKDFFDGIHHKIDTIYSSNFGLNEEDNYFALILDSNRVTNSYSKSISFSDGEIIVYKDRLIKCEKKEELGKLISYYHIVRTDSTGFEYVLVIDENFILITADYQGIILQLENEDKAINLENCANLNFYNVIPVDLDYTNLIQSNNDDSHIKSLTFEIEGGSSNNFSIHNNQNVFFENNKKFITLSREFNYSELATTIDINNNLIETDKYPIKDIEIITLAENVTKSGQTKREKIGLLLKYVHDYIEDSYLYCDHLTVHEILKQKKGDCSDHAFLFTVLSRAIGIPCKEIQGFALDSKNKNLVGHAWNEVEIDGKWVEVDPTFNLWLPTMYHFRVKDDTLIFFMNDIKLHISNISYFKKR